MKHRFKLFFVPLLLLSGLSIPVSAAETENTRIGPEFAKLLLEMDALNWDTLGSEIIPLEQQQEPVYKMLDRLRTSVPKSFLKSGTTPLPQPLSMLVMEDSLYRGRAFELKGTATLVEELPLNPVEQKTFRLPMFFRCRLSVNGDQVDVLTPTAPVAWKRNEPINENVVVWGIYIKKVAPNENVAADKASEEKTTDKEPKSDEKPSNDAIFGGKMSNLIPLFVAPGIEWYPDTLLGKLGMDVGAFDQIPVLKISDLKKKELNVAEPLQLLDRSEIARRAFKFTEADRDPFYGLLKAAADAPRGQLGKIARDSMEKEGKTEYSAVKLFTQPTEQQNKLVLLYGTAKRVIPTLVEDEEIRKLYGIDKYYQIYFFTDDSRGNPLVACVTELPKGMPVGSGTDYAERISIAGFFYKLWVYESSAVVEKPGKEGETYKPNFAPLLIGRNPDWYPSTPKRIATEHLSGGMSLIPFAVVAGLAVLWVALLRRRPKKPIEFKLRK